MDRQAIARHKAIERCYVVRAIRETMDTHADLDDRMRRDLFSFLLDHDKWQRRYNRRIASRVTKGYKVNPRNKTMQEFRACRGSRRRCTRLKNIALSLGLLVVTDPHSWFQAKCAGYDVGQNVLDHAEQLQKANEEARERHRKHSERVTTLRVCV